MTLDSLATAIIAVSSEEPAIRLAKHLLDWKGDDSSVEDLSHDTERFIGYIWFSTDEIHERIYKLWSKFRSSSIHKISGMTMNERLYCFGLESRFNSAQTENARNVIYKKLHAHA